MLGEAAPHLLREVGRALVAPDYQRDYAPLLLHWKGIARMAARAGVRTLFGPSSIGPARRDEAKGMSGGMPGLFAVGRERRNVRRPQPGQSEDARHAPFFGAQVQGQGRGGVFLNA